MYQIQWCLTVWQSDLSSDEASAVVYSILIAISKYSNALHIVSTYYPILMKLTNKFKERAGIKNFKVSVEEKTNQKLYYAYKVVPGEAD